MFDQSFEALIHRKTGIVSASELMEMTWAEMAYMIERYNSVNKQK